MAISDKDIGSIMGRLMEKQKKAEQAAGNTVESGAAGAPAAEADTPAGEYVQDPAQEEPGTSAEEFYAEPEAEDDTGTLDDGRYETLLDDVLSVPQDGYAADGESAAKLNELYRDYIRGEDGEEEIGNVPEPAEEAPADIARAEETPADSGKAGEDDILMAALGYSKDERPEKPASGARHRSGRREYESDMSDAIAYDGREYRSVSQKGEIRRAYDREQRILYLRLAGTGLFAVLLLIFELAGGRFGGALSRSEYPVVHIMASLQLLILCAAFSWRRIAGGTVRIFRGNPDGSSIAAAAVILTAVYDIAVAVAVGGRSDVPFTLYNFAAALTLCVLAGADQLRLAHEKRNFNCLSRFESFATLEKVTDSDSGRAYRLHRGGFVADYFRRSNRRSSLFRITNYIIAPAVALSAVLFIISLASGKGFIPSAGTFIAATQLILPAYMIIACELPFRILSLGRLDRSAVVLSEADTEEFARVDKIILDETDLFSEESLKIIKVQQCAAGVDIFEVMSATSAVCAMVGGTISRAFRSISDAESMGNVPAVRVARAEEGGIEAYVGGKQYLLGNMRFLGEYGVACRGCSDNEYAASTRGGTVFHIAVNRREIFRYYMQYVPDPTFITLAGGMAEKGIGIEIRCKDPNLSAAFVSSMIGNDNVRPMVVRSTESDVEPDPDGVIEGGLISDGEQWMSVIRAADSCQLYRAVSRLNGWILLALFCIAGLAAVLLGAFGTLSSVPAIVIVLIQVLSLIPSVIVSRLLIS